MWFEKLMGFEEVSHENVQKNIEIVGDRMVSRINGKSYQWGKFEVPTLEELRERIVLEEFSSKISVSETVGNVQRFHCDSENANAVFQAASQFNMLEMVSPRVTPEAGVGIYENDRTQGPACAVACGAGTVYRNYFDVVNGQIGQTENNQIDGLEHIGKALGNDEFKLWEMQNGYCFPNENGLHHINTQIAEMTDKDREQLKGKLKVGIQWNSEVTIANPEQIVTQVYSSALPIGYSAHFPPSLWEYLAKIILEATYEATFCTALINFEKTGCNKLFLTLVGGGVFANPESWILDAIKRSVQKFQNTPLDVKIVSYGHSNYSVRNMIAELKE